MEIFYKGFLQQELRINGKNFEPVETIKKQVFMQISLNLGQVNGYISDSMLTSKELNSLQILDKKCIEQSLMGFFSQWLSPRK